MIYRKIAYLNIIFLVFLLVHMGVHFSILSSTLQLLQGSEGLTSANIGIMGYEIISGYGNHFASFMPPFFTMVFILSVYAALSIKFWGNRLLIFNLSLIVLSLPLYYVYLSGLNSNLELAVISDNFVFKNVNMFGYEFMDITSIERRRIVESSLEKGFNFSLIPLALSLIGNMMYVFRVRHSL